MGSSVLAMNMRSADKTNINGGKVILQCIERLAEALVDGNTRLRLYWTPESVRLAMAAWLEARGYSGDSVDEFRAEMTGTKSSTATIT